MESKSLVIQISIILHICRISLAVIWIYQGLVPKLLYLHADELTMTESIQPFFMSAKQLSITAGMLEIIFGMLIFLNYKRKLMYRMSIVSMVALLIAVVLLTPQFLNSAFNAVSLNLAGIMLAWIAIICLRSNGYEWTYRE